MLWRQRLAVYPPFICWIYGGRQYIQWLGMRDMNSEEPTLGANQTINVGEPTVIESYTPDETFGVVFEDDGETAYFYALNCSLTDQPIVDAMHIYSVEGVTDRHIPSEVHILWSSDFRKAVLIINRYPHAVFDFETKRGYSRDQFPEPSCGWTHEPWDDSLRDHFFKKGRA